MFFLALSLLDGALDFSLGLLLFPDLLPDSPLLRDDQATYMQAINCGAAIAPSVLAYERRVLHGIRESEQARFYAEMADAETKETGNIVTRLEIIEREIEDYEGKINALPNVNLMKRKLAKLELVRQEVKPKKYTENQLILRDAIKVERLILFRVETQR